MKFLKTTLQSSAVMLAFLSVSAAGLYSCSSNSDPRPGLSSENDKMASTVISADPSLNGPCTYNATLQTTPGAATIKVWEEPTCPIPLPYRTAWAPTTNNTYGAYQISTELLPPTTAPCNGQWVFRQGKTYYLQVGTGQMLKMVVGPAATGVCLTYNISLNNWSSCNTNYDITFFNVSKLGCHTVPDPY